MKFFLGALCGLVLSCGEPWAQDLTDGGASSSSSGRSSGKEVESPSSPTDRGSSPPRSRARTRSVFAHDGSVGIDPSCSFSEENLSVSNSEKYTPLKLWRDIERGNVSSILLSIPTLKEYEGNKSRKDETLRQRSHFYEGVIDHIVTSQNLPTLAQPLLGAVFPEKDAPGSNMDHLISRAREEFRRQLFGKATRGEASPDLLKQLPLEHQRMLAVLHEQYNSTDDWNPLLYQFMELLVSFQNPFVMIEIIYRHLKDMKTDSEEESVGVDREEYRGILSRLLGMTCNEEKDPDLLMEGFLASFYLVARGFGTRSILGKREGFPKSKSVAFALYASMSGVSSENIHKQIKNTREERRKMSTMLMDASKYVNAEENLITNFATLRWLLLFKLRAAHCYERGVGCKNSDPQKGRELYGEYLSLITSHNHTSSSKITAMSL